MYLLNRPTFQPPNIAYRFINIYKHYINIGSLYNNITNLSNYNIMRKFTISELLVSGHWKSCINSFLWAPATQLSYTAISAWSSNILFSSVMNPLGKSSLFIKPGLFRKIPHQSCLPCYLYQLLYSTIYSQHLELNLFKVSGRPHLTFFPKNLEIGDPVPLGCTLLFKQNICSLICNWFIFPHLFKNVSDIQQFVQLQTENLDYMPSNLEHSSMNVFLKEFPEFAMRRSGSPK